jgi:hypothetical protein
MTCYVHVCMYLCMHVCMYCLIYVYMCTRCVCELDQDVKTNFRHLFEWLCHVDPKQRPQSVDAVLQHPWMKGPMLSPKELTETMKKRVDGYRKVALDMVEQNIQRNMAKMAKLQTDLAKEKGAEEEDADPEAQRLERAYVGMQRGGQPRECPRFPRLASLTPDQPDYDLHILSPFGPLAVFAVTLEVLNREFPMPPCDDDPDECCCAKMVLFQDPDEHGVLRAEVSHVNLELHVHVYTPTTIGATPVVVSMLKYAEYDACHDVPIPESMQGFERAFANSGPGSHRIHHPDAQALLQQLHLALQSPSASSEDLPAHIAYPVAKKWTPPPTPASEADIQGTVLPACVHSILVVILIFL